MKLINRSILFTVLLSLSLIILLSNTGLSLSEISYYSTANENYSAVPVITPVPSRHFINQYDKRPPKPTQIPERLFEGNGQNNIEEKEPKVNEEQIQSNPDINNLSNNASLKAVSSTINSVTFNSIFPKSGDYWNGLAYWDPDTQQWYAVPGQGYYATNGNHTVSGLKPYTNYYIFMSWYDYNNECFCDLPFLSMKTKGYTPSLTLVSTTSNSITFNSVFPKSGDYWNGLAYWDPNKGQWLAVPGQGYYATNGNHTINGLQPNTTYVLFMSWWDSDTGTWADLPWLYVTTKSDSGIPQSVLDAIKGVSGDEEIILTQGCLSVMGFPMGNSGPNGNGVDGSFGPTTKFWLLEYKFKKGMSIKNNKGRIEAIIDENTINSLLQSVRDGETMQSLGIKKGTNPTKTEVINYITLKANEKGVPVRLAFATAWTENEMKHFNSNGSPGPNGTNDWGLMQINSNSHYSIFEGAFDNDPSTPDVVRNWKDNVDYGIEYLFDRYKYASNYDNGQWGATGISLGESKMGPASTRPITNLARASYACYNSGSRYYRYRLTKNEALSQGLNITCYSSLDSYGYDLRDNNYWKHYWNESWD